MSTKEQKDSKNSFIKPERTPKYFLILWAANTIMAIIIWPLCDLLFSAILTHSQFTYSPWGHIAEPAIYMFILTVVEFLTWNVWNKPKDGEKDQAKPAKAKADKKAKK